MTFTNPYQPTPTLRRTSSAFASGSFFSYVIAIGVIWIAFVAISLTNIFGNDVTFLAIVLAGATIGIVSHRITLLVSRYISDILLLILPVLFVLLATFERSPRLEEILAEEPGLMGIAIGFLWFETMIPIVTIVGVAKLIQKMRHKMRCSQRVGLRVSWHWLLPLILGVATPFVAMLFCDGDVNYYLSENDPRADDGDDYFWTRQGWLFPMNQAHSEWPLLGVQAEFQWLPIGIVLNIVVGIAMWYCIWIIVWGISHKSHKLLNR